MKKTIPALLLIAAMLFSLCACGGAPTQNAAPEAAKTEAQENNADTPADSETATEAAAPAAEPTPEPEPEPEKLYVTREKDLLVRKTVEGQALPTFDYEVLGRVFDLATDYVYDEFGELTEEREHLVYPRIPDVFDYLGGEREDYEYSYTPSGALESVTYSNRTYNGIKVYQTLRFDGDHLLENRSTTPGEDKPLALATYIYGDNGQVVREENTTYVSFLSMARLKVPLVDNYEFDEKGYCTRWEHEDDDGAYSVDFAYNGDGNLTRVEVLTDGEPYDLMEIRYTDGVQSSLTRTREGETVEYAFSYNEDGLPASMSCEYDGKQQEVVFSYNEDGLLASADWRTDGRSGGKTTYTYTTEDDGDIYFELKGQYGPYPFGKGRTNGIYFSKSYTNYKGQPMTDRSYTIKPVLTTLRYVEEEIDYEYETRKLRFEADPAEVDSSITVEDLYPAFETICGEPYPTPDGTMRLLRAEMRDMPRVTVAAEPVWLSDGSCAGVLSRFDGEGDYQNWRYKEETTADEQGRITYNPNSRVSYVWAEDGKSYTITYSNGNEAEITPDKQQIPVLLKRALSHEDWEYNEDGLPSKEVWLMGPGPDAEKRIDAYSYFWDDTTTDWGAEKNCRILKASNGSYDQIVMVFNEHGYLIYYSLPGNPHFEYIYE